MKTKLTLTIDGSVISIAKKFAKKKHKTENISHRILKLMGSIILSDNYENKKGLTKGLLKKYKS